MNINVKLVKGTLGILSAIGSTAIVKRMEKAYVPASKYVITEIGIKVFEGVIFAATVDLFGKVFDETMEGFRIGAEKIKQAEEQIKKEESDDDGIHMDTDETDFSEV